MMKTKTLENAQRPLSMHPKKFALWLFMVTVVMLFAAFTSAYLVRRDAGNWLLFNLPSLLNVNTVVIILSSVTMQLAYWAAKKDELEKLKLYILATTILGIAFLVLQVFAWGQLVDGGIFFGGKGSNPAGSFLYVFTGLHGFHLISGVIYLLVVLFKTFNYQVHSKNMLQIEMCTTYWHFLDLLWVYLYVFLLINN